MKSRSKRNGRKTQRKEKSRSYGTIPGHKSNLFGIAVIVGLVTIIAMLIILAERMF